MQLFSLLTTHEVMMRPPSSAKRLHQQWSLWPRDKNTSTSCTWGSFFLKNHPQAMLYYKGKNQKLGSPPLVWTDCKVLKTHRQLGSKLFATPPGSVEVNSTLPTLPPSPGDTTTTNPWWFIFHQFKLGWTKKNSNFVKSEKFGCLIHPLFRQWRLGLIFRYV